MELTSLAFCNLKFLLELEKDDVVLSNRRNLYKQDEFVQIENVQELEHTFYFTFNHLLNTKHKYDIDIKELLDDMNTPLYISKLHELFHQSQNGDQDKKKEFNKACRLIGLFNESNEKRDEYKKSKVKISEDNILSKIKDREEAKKAGNYNLADQIRDDLNKEGIDIKDEKGKTTWNYK